MAALTRLQTLSLGSQTLSLAQFTTGKAGNLILEDFVQRELPPDLTADAARQSQVGFILEELARHGDVKVPVRYAVSGQSVFARFVKLPPMGEQKVEEIVEFEAQQNVPFPIQEVIWDYELFTDQASGETEVGLVAIKADVLNQINEQVEDARFKVKGVDVAPMALLNAFRYNYPDTKEPSVLIDIGARTTNLVFSEEGRVFTRSLPVGGAAVTTAISKEFNESFDEAEKRKLDGGYVALGGAYAENPDPNLAAVGRCARTAMTRLHAEVARTINYYRSQLGGNQPRLAFLCGGGAAMPYTKEFFEEKLKLPVDYFNGLRNLAVGREVAETAGGLAYRLGEHVGLALRSVSNCPLEIDLEPDVVALRRETKARAPLWVGAAACLIAGAGALVGHAQFSASKSASIAQDLSEQEKEVSSISRRISNAFDRVDRIDRVRQPLLDAVIARDAWPALLDKLNGYFASDVVWVTDVNPLRNGEVFIPPMADDSERPQRSASLSREEQEAAAKEVPQITAIKVRGLWRATASDQNAGQDKVRTIFQTIQQDSSSPFDGGGMHSAQNLTITGQDDLSFAWPFEMTLPLRTPLPLD